MPGSPRHDPPEVEVGGPAVHKTPAAPVVAHYVELGGSEFVYLDRSVEQDVRHWTAHHLVAPDVRLDVDPLDLPTLEGSSPQWPRTWDTAVSTLRMAPGGQRSVWPGAEDILTVSRAAQVRQLAGNRTDCGVCALLSTVGTLLRSPRPGNLLSMVDRRWVAVMVLNKDLGTIMRLPSLGELPAAALGALPAPHAPLAVADIGHQTGLPDARLRHALLCLAAAEGGMSLIVSVSLQHVRTAMQRRTPHALRPWEEHAQRWLRVEDLVPTHVVGQADMGQVVVMEGTGFWACGWVERGSLDWIVVTADKLVRQQSKGSTCYGVLRDHLRFMGPVRRAQRCSPGDIPPAPVVFVEVTAEPHIPGQDVLPSPPTCGGPSGRPSFVQRCDRMRQPFLGRRRRGRPATGRRRPWRCCTAALWVAGVVLGHRGAGAALLCPLYVQPRRGARARDPPGGPRGPAPRYLEQRRGHRTVPPGNIGGCCGALVP